MEQIIILFVVIVLFLLPVKGDIDNKLGSKYTLNIDTNECRNAFKNDVDNLKAISRKYKRRSNKRFHPNSSLELSDQVPYVYEDIHEEDTKLSRWNSMTMPANEITVVHKYKFVYVANRKCGQTEMNTLLRIHFGARDFTGCSCENLCCGYVLSFGRCSTLCLKDTEIKDYFFFTFVRHPYDRFFSAFKQAFWILKRGKIGEVSDAMLALRKMNNSHIIPNEHFETQSLQLFSQIQNGLATIPYDFIGKLENYNSDIETLFRLIANHSKMELPKSLNIFLKKLSSGTHRGMIKNSSSNTSKAKLEAVRHGLPVEGVEMIKNIYKQDYLCFNYT